NGIRLGIRPHAGPNKGQLEWRLPTRDTVTSILEHPAYAGYYCYGRHRVDARRKQPGKPGSGRGTGGPHADVALLPDRIPAYVTKQRFEAIQRRLADNRARAASKGAPREGSSLLAGLVVCARCGRRMIVHYSGRGRQIRYTCTADTGACPRPRRHSF